MERTWGLILYCSVLEDKLELPLFGAAQVFKQKNMRGSLVKSLGSWETYHMHFHI
jgi:hypothetical protein